MGAKAQQALERGSSTTSGGANQRNQAGTRRANAQALKRSGIKFNRVADAPSQDSKQGSKWPSGKPMGITGIEDGYGGMGYGPTQTFFGATDGGALKKTKERADPGRLIRDAVGAMSAPKVVRATGSIWDDEKYSAMANEHGAEFAMRARNLDRKINSAKKYREMLDAGRERRYEEEGRRREDMLHENATQQQIAATGTPEQIEQVFGPGAKRNEDGSISRATSGDYDATDETGAFTGGRSGAPEDQLMSSQVPATGKEAAEAERESEEAGRKHELTKEAIKSNSEAMSAELGKDYPDKERLKGLMKERDRLMGIATDDGESDGAQSIKGPDGKEYNIGDQLPNGRTLKGINPDGTLEVE